MTAPSRATIAYRLAVARRMLARRASAPPVHLADQFDAADREARQLHDRLTAVLPVVAPDRPWHQRVDMEPSEMVRTYLLAAVLGCTTVCLHLRRGGPQPAIFRLALRRADCRRCVRTLRRPPADETDRCDVCGARGIVTFAAFAVRQGTALVVGDACDGCARVLGIRQGAVS